MNNVSLLGMIKTIQFMDTYTMEHNKLRKKKLKKEKEIQYLTILLNPLKL